MWKRIGDAIVEQRMYSAPLRERATSEGEEGSSLSSS